MPAEITLFTAPKPFTNPHIALIQYNALRSWVNLGPQVEVILVGEEEGLAQAAGELGVRHLPQVARNAQGTPLVSSIFKLALEASRSPLMAYVNADVLLLPDFVQSALRTAELARHFLIVGQRWDLDLKTSLDFSGGWEQRLRDLCQSEGRWHTRNGSDYFIFPRACFQNIPDFAIGRAGWDNWMIYEARRSGWPVVDATASIQVIHQSHDYSHLPNGQAHYRLPETFENVRLAGGKRTIFTMADTNRRLVEGRLLPVKSNWTKFWREVEIFPLVKLHSMALGQLAYAIFHPRKAYQELRKH